MRIILTVILFRMMGETVLDNSWHTALGYTQILFTLLIFTAAGNILQAKRHEAISQIAAKINITALATPRALIWWSFVPEARMADGIKRQNAHQSHLAIFSSLTAYTAAGMVKI